MIPYRDDNPTLRPAVVTLALIAANVAIWLVIQGLGQEPALSRSVCRLGLIPGELLGRVSPGETLRLSRRTVCVLGETGQWYTALTSMFLHGGWFHLLGNMWFLWVFGNNVEDSMGRLRFLAFYLLSGLAAAGAQILSDPGSALPMVGASGAIGGVMGAYVVLYPKVRVHMFVFLGIFITTIVVPAYLMLGYWFLLQLVGGLPGLAGDGGGVAFWAHVGGFVAGALLSFPFRNATFLAQHQALLRQVQSGGWWR